MLYTDVERAIMQSAANARIRTVNISPSALQCVIADFTLARWLPGSAVLDLAPQQCDFLDLARKAGAETSGVDPDPCIVALGTHRGHRMHVRSLRDEFASALPAPGGVFCRGGFNPYWFASDTRRLERQLQQLSGLLAGASWAWIAPFLNPGTATPRAAAEVESTWARWCDANNLHRWRPGPAHRTRYGINYGVPMVEVWLKGLSAPGPSEPLPAASSRLDDPGERQVEVSGRSQPRPASGATTPKTLQHQDSPQEAVTRSALIERERYPREHYLSLLDAIKERGDIECLTFDDLDFGDDWNHQNYPVEWERWSDALNSGARDPEKAYLLITHDTDSGPVQSIAMAQVERDSGLRSSIFTFNRIRNLNIAGAEIEPYPIDWEQLRDLRDSGFCIGYHANSLHLAKFDESQVPPLFAEDLDQLAANGFPISFYTAHGGWASPTTKRRNRDFDFASLTGRNVRLVGNGGQVRREGGLSDGALLAKARNGDPLPDFHRFVRSMKRGLRYWVLVHPQYYEF